MDETMSCLVYELHEDTKSVEIIKIDDFGRAGKYTSLFATNNGSKELFGEIAIDIPTSISDVDLCNHVKAVLVHNIGIEIPWLIQANVTVKPERENKAIFEYRSIRSIVLCVLLPIACFGANNKREVINGIEWEIATDNSTYTLASARSKDQWGGQGVTTSAVGIRPVDRSVVAGAIKIPTSIQREKVTRICTDAFRECVGLTAVTIPDGIMEIGVRAFYGCTNLVSVDLGKVRYIGSGAFGAPASKDGVWKMNLKSIVLPKELERIEKTSFAGFPYYVNDVIGSSGCFTYLKSVAIADAKILSEPVLGRAGGSGEYYYKNGYFANATVYTSEELYDVVRTGMQSATWGYGSYVKEIKIGWSNPVFEPAENLVSCGTTVKIKSMSNNENVKVYYTTDGSAPTNCVTENCYLYTRPIPIMRKTTINAVAYVDTDSIYAEVSSMDYGFGTIGAIHIASTFPAKFYKSGNVITLSCETEDAEIRYTLDNCEPTEDSALYMEPFAIDNTTTIKAKAFKTDWFESETATATFSREWYTVDMPIIEPSGAEFENTSQEVSIGCDTDGATIYYTTDGSDPKVNGREYKHPFTIYNTCTVRAVAAKDDWKDSTEATATFTRKEALSAAVNLYGYKMESGESAWTADETVSHDGVSSIKSNGDGSYVQTSVRGAGTLSFWWRAMCEEPEDGEYYDYGVFKVGSAESAYIAGNDTGWMFFSTNIATTGKHTLRWEYRKDDEGTFAPDCVWLDQVQWVPADGSGTTLTSPEPVPYSWLSQYGLGVASGDFEAAANAASGKTQGGAATSVWEEFVAGTDPTNALNVFTAKIEMHDGVPFVTWSPDLNTNSIQRMYKVYGRESLDAESPWQYPTNSLHKFFKVTVEMP